MKNIKEYLKSEDTDIILYHKNGKMGIRYFEGSEGFWYENTYDENGNNLKRKNSEGFWYECTYDGSGNELTYKSSSDFWHECTYDGNGNELTYKDSEGFWTECTYDENGNELTYKSSEGTKIGFDIEEMTIEQVCKALGKTIKITK